MRLSIVRASDWPVKLVATGFVFLALVLAGAPASHAQDSAEDEVRTMLNQMYRGALFGAPLASFESGGAIRLRQIGVQHGPQFDVLIPSVEVVADDGRRTELGDLAFVVTVLGEGRFALAGELPDEIVFREPEDAEAGRVVIGEHRFDGVWNSAISQFETMEWQSGAIRAIDPSDVVFMTISSAGLTVKLEQTSPTHGDSVAEMELRDIFIIGDSDLVRIDRVAVNGAARNVDLAGYGKLVEDLAAEPAHNPADPYTSSALNDLILSNLRVLGDLEYFMSIEGLSGRLGGFAPNVERFSVESVEFGFGMEGFDEPAGTIRLRYGHRGVDIPVEEVPQGVVPRSVGLRLSVQNIPFKALSEAVQDYIENPANLQSESGRDELLTARFIEILTDAESLLAIDELSLESDVMVIDGEGTVRPGSTSQVPVTGKGRVTIHGLERLQREILSDLSADTLGYVAIIGILIALGEEIEDERGRAFVYNIEVGPEGNLLINGEDFAPLIEELNSP